MTIGLDARQAANQVLVTANDKGPQINIVAWTAMVVMILSVGTRLAIKYNAFRSFGWDDGFVTVAMVLAISQAAAVSMQVSDGGLGQRIASLSSSQIQSFEKGQYASDILYIATLYFSKLSSLAYIIQFTPDAQHRRWGKGVLLIVTIWVIPALFGVFFECHMPHPWAIVTAQCMKIDVFWDVIGALDILTDFLLIALPCYIIWNLQMSTNRKAVVTVAFGCRIILFPIVVLRLVYLASALSSSDKTFDYRNTIFVTIANTDTSVLVACIPFLKPFMQGLDSGLLTSDLRVRGPKTSLFANISSARNTNNNSKERSYPLKKVSNKDATMTSDLGRLRDVGIRNEATVVHDPPQHDFESRTSAGSDKMIIKKTTDWNVDYDGADGEEHGHAV